MKKVIQQELSVRFTYPVVFTRDVFDPANPALRDLLAPAVAAHPDARMVVYLDAGPVSARPALAGEVRAYMQSCLPRLTLPMEPKVLPGGEGIKSDRAAVERIMRDIADAQLDRHSFVMAVGGGAVLDAVGYAASLVHRGIRMLRLPTTVLGQNDAGVGVKTAINDAAGKNFFGTFAPPWAVVNDTSFLALLPDAEWRNGIAEAFKVALIRDAAFFDWLCEHAEALAARDVETMEELVYRCAELHLHHIRAGGDPFEQGEARPLDYGHWSAHQLEAMTGYAISHGQAVAAGIMLDALYAVSAGFLDEAVAERLFAGLLDSGFDLWRPELDRRDDGGVREIFRGLDRFREHLGGRLCITLPVGPGEAREVNEIDVGKMEAALEALKRRAEPAR